MIRTISARRLADLINALQQRGYRAVLDDFEVTVDIPDRDAVLVEAVEADIAAQSAALTTFGKDYRAMIADHLAAVH